MSQHSGNRGRGRSGSSTPVKWTLVEAEPETPHGRRGKQQGHTRPRGHTAGSSGSGSNSWRIQRDGGRGRGGSAHSYGGHRGGRRGSTSRTHHHGHERGRGHSEGYVGGGVTYYPLRDYVMGPSLEEQHAYMINMAVKQIEFYFTVENLCRDIFMRSYMDEEGYIPIAFVANFPGVARFGVDLQDIIAGIVASDILQVDLENETMRMREGWEVWLLPNQGTGKQGVPRYIKVASEDSVDTADGEEHANTTGDTQDVVAPEQKAPPAATRNESSESGQDSRQAIEIIADQLATSGIGQTDLKDENHCPNTDGDGGDQNSNEATPSSQEGSGVSKEQDQDACGNLASKKGLTPTAPAWTPDDPPAPVRCGASVASESNKTLHAET